MHSSAIAGACAGLVSSVVTCPLDVVKTRLQAQEGRRPAPSGAAAGTARSIGPSAAVLRGDIVAEESARYLGLSDTLKKIWRDGGVRGFYRGLGPTIFGYLPTWAIYFTVYDSCKQFLAHDMNSSTGEEDFLNHILSAMTAGAASTICTSPLWVVKTRFMLQSVKDTSVKPYRHTGDAFVQIYRSEGLRGFYKGLLPSLFGVSHVAVQFPLYESFKSLARERLQSDELAPSTILLCSSSAKMIASVTTYPHEVLRTRLQMQPRNKVASTSSRNISHMANKGMGGRYSGVIQACRTIAREEGIRGFYKGMAVNLVRTVPSSALTILTYEVIMQHLAQLEHEHQQLNPQLSQYVSHDNASTPDTRSS
ncbi:mitochondrial carrier [Testicularia cyperi]|uniref:Mitochondrial carrier n=1 Tax=Testicularia cyperi TaxID=1882483 RepID=A0A317XSD1_9BASI|nr:mitochondrial carrier [Testicularia cyperi]